MNFNNDICGEQMKVMVVLWTYLLQEAFDYIGSSRMAYEMKKGNMNFTVDNIEMFIEIGQIGLHSAPTVWLHSGLNESKEVTDHILCSGISWL